MRFLATLLFLALLVFGVWSFQAAESFGAWLPPHVSSFGAEIDFLFNLILWMVAFFFVLTEGVLVYCIWRFSKKDPSKALFSHGSHKLEMLWTAIPAVLLLVIAFAQMSAWANMRFESKLPDGEPIAIAWASQFDWRFQYPGADGEFGTMDDFESAYEFVVPVGEPVKFILRSRDVIHSFSVPQFRLKQDAMPGMAIPVWFKVEDPDNDGDGVGDGDNAGDYELICMELCGWGHYKMAGMVRALPRDEYDAWVLDQQAHFMSNGIEE